MIKLTKKAPTCISIKIGAMRKIYSFTTSICCSICFDDFKNDSLDNQSILVTPCGHIYHQQCLTKWSKQSHPSSKNCPDCRFTFRIDQTKRVYFNFSSVANDTIETELNDLTQQISERDVELNRLEMEKKTITKSFNALDGKYVELKKILAEQGKFCENLLERTGQNTEQNATVKRQIDYVDSELDRIMIDCHQMEMKMKIIEKQLDACDLNGLSAELKEFKKNID